MPRSAEPSRSLRNTLPRLAQAATIARLAEPPRLNALDQAGRAMVLAVRLLALNSRVGRDPLPDLLRHLQSVEATTAFIALADALGTRWPDRVQVLRPCCGLLSPDEATMAALASTARAGDRAAFCAQIDGFIRSDRHDRLFDLAVRLGAALPPADPA